MKCANISELGSEQAVKAAGKLGIEGKDSSCRMATSCTSGSTFRARRSRTRPCRTESPGSIRLQNVHLDEHVFVLPVIIDVEQKRGPRRLLGLSLGLFCLSFGLLIELGINIR